MDSNAYLHAIVQNVSRIATLVQNLREKEKAIQQQQVNNRETKQKQLFKKQIIVGQEPARKT